MNDAAEESYWRFDARRKGYGEWKQTPQSERDAYKAEYSALRAQLAEVTRERDELRLVVDRINVHSLHVIDEDNAAPDAQRAQRILIDGIAHIQELAEKALEPKP